MSSTFDKTWAILKERVKKLPHKNFSEIMGFTNPPLAAHIEEAMKIHQDKFPRASSLSAERFTRPQALERPGRKTLELSPKTPLKRLGYQNVSPDIVELMQIREEERERLNRIGLNLDIDDPEQHKKDDFGKSEELLVSVLLKSKKKSKPFHGYNPNKHSRKGGLNAKGRAKFKRETGANLKPPVTTKPSKLKPGSKKAKRRKSFCARMGGVKGPTSKGGKLTPKGAALKRWNC